MAKRRRQKEKLKEKQRRQKELRPANRLAEALELAQQGDWAKALPLAEAAFSAANDNRTLERAGKLSGELHLRLAAQATNLDKRLQHLQQGEASAPEDSRARFAYHTGITLLALHRYDAAGEALTRARQLGARDEALATALAQQLAGQPPETSALGPDQKQLLEALRDLQQGNADAQQRLTTFVDQQPNAPQRDLWQALLQMQKVESASPLAGLEEAQSDSQAVLVQPLIAYYVGVAALRRRDHNAAVAAWQEAQTQGLNTPWFLNNQRYLLRQAIEELADQKDWAALVERLSGHSELKTSAPLREHLAYAHFYLGEESARAQRWQEAARHWRCTYELDPSRYVAQNLALAEESLENWGAAASAWRELVRRRPRKENHADYLDEEQVATVWKRASDCYEYVDDVEEQITCLSKAIEYAPERLPWRIELVQLYQNELREEAAENELQRILTIDAEYLPALLVLASFYDERWDQDSIPIWQRALAVEPANLEIQDGLANAYVDDMFTGGMSSPFGRLFASEGNSVDVKQIEQGLKALPTHPLLLLEAGLRYLRGGRDKKARPYFVQAAEAALQDSTRYLPMLDSALHELLHVEGEAEVERLLPEVTNLPKLRSAFWVSQGRRVLRCRLNLAWAERFWQEAFSLAEQGRGGDTPVLIVALILDALASELGESEDEDFAHTLRGLMQQYADRGAALAPDSGIVAYAEAIGAMLEEENIEKSKRLLRKAKRQAKKAGESEFVEAIEMHEAMLNPAASLFSRLLNLEGGALPDMPHMPDLAELAELFDDLDDEDFF